MENQPLGSTNKESSITPTDVAVIRSNMGMLASTKARPAAMIDAAKTEPSSSSTLMKTSI